MRAAAPRVSEHAPQGGGAPAEAIEVSILMPCLNEAATLALCIRKARHFLETSGVVGEVIVADNGSTDGSRQIAVGMGARLVGVSERGYGAALRGGIAAARGRYVVMGDADDSYDFADLMPFVHALRAGGQLVMGNRFKGGIAPGAMPFLHRYLGNPVLSFLGRRFYNARVGDFHCGLRGFDRAAIQSLGLGTRGMEFASEMVVKAVLYGLDVREVPTTLRPDGRDRAPHLRTWRDGWRHLRFLLTYAPRVLFVIPGIALALPSLIAVAVLALGDVAVAGVELSATSLLFAAMALLLGSQLIGFGIVARLFGAANAMWPASARVRRFRRWFSVERGCQLGAALMLAGLAGAALLLWRWQSHGFGAMEPVTLMRQAIPAMLATLLGAQTIFTSFLIGLIDRGER